MLAAALIVFREVLEAALIVTIILAATKGAVGRRRAVLAGMGAGIAGSVLVATVMGSISAALDGHGQDLFNAAIMFSAVGLLSWHIVWMNSHGKHIADRLKQVGQQVVLGQASLFTLGLVVFTAVLREGVEVVMFMQGLMVQNSAAALWTGGGAGLAAGLVVGSIIYFGLLRLPLTAMFKTTNVLLVLIAAGMAARGVNVLVQAGWLPDSDVVWNTSMILSDQTIIGEMLGTLIGYVAEPTGAQVIAYAATVIMITALMRMADKKMQQQKMATAI